MSEERKLLAEIEKKNENGASWSEWDAFLLGRIALALAQIVDRLDTITDALDSFRPKNVEPEEEDDWEEYDPDEPRFAGMHVLERDKQCETCRHSGSSAECCRDCKHGAWRGVCDRYASKNGGEDNGEG